MVEVVATGIDSEESRAGNATHGELTATENLSDGAEDIGWKGEATVMPS